MKLARFLSLVRCPEQCLPILGQKLLQQLSMSMPTGERCISLCVTRNKTYSSRDSHVVTHRSTNLPFNCLCMAERTGCPVFS
ncbi:hypothetical protein KCU62_g8644, partial [Aureobasidium sp. EXF-3399]